MKNLITVFLMSVMTLFTFNANSQTPFYEVGNISYTPNPFEIGDFSVPGTSGMDYYVGTGGNGSVYVQFLTNSVEITYDPNLSGTTLDISGKSDIEINFETEFGQQNGTIDSIEFYVDGSLVETLNSPNLSNAITLNGLDGSSLSFIFHISATSFNAIFFRHLSLTDVSQSTTGIDENDISDDFNIYSYNNNLVVKTNEFTPYNVTVYNMGGQVVMNENNSGNMETQLYVPSGIYIVKVTSSAGILNKKIVIR